MRTIFKLGWSALLLSTVFFSCKQGEASQEEAAFAAGASMQSDNATSSKVVANKIENRKFIRTADIKFKVDDVPKSTDAIENITRKFGGFVTYTNLQSHITEKKATKVSLDSTLETTRYNIENNITIRVPNTQLDTVVKAIAKQIDFLDSRVIKADDVSLLLLSNRLAQNRSVEKESRVAIAIDTKGKKLNTIIDAEDKLAATKEQNDTKKMESLALQDQVAFSTLTLQIYQPETYKQTLVATVKTADEYRPHIGLQLWDALKTGWFILESMLAFVVQLWSVLLLLVLAIYVYRKRIRKVAPNFNEA